MTNQYYVYVLLDSSKKGNFVYGDVSFVNEPFYIGKGIGNRIRNTVKDKYNSYKFRKISKMKESKIDIISEKIFENLSNEDAIRLEIDLISKIGRRDMKRGPLSNLTDGGDGRLSSPHSDEVKLKISKTKKEQNIRTVHTDDTKNFLSIINSGSKNPMYGNTHSCEVKENHSKYVSGTNHPMYGKKHNEESRKVMREKRSTLDDSKLREFCKVFRKPIKMFDLNLNFIKEFDSLKEAGYETGINQSVISKCCRGEIVSPTRYYFQYSDSKSKIKSNSFLIKINDEFNFVNKKYILLERKKRTCICKDDENNVVNIRIKEYPYLFVKDMNDSDFIEFYLFVRSICPEIKMDRSTYCVFSDHIKIYFNYLLKSSEIFKDKNEIFNRRQFYGKVINIFEDQWESKKEIIKSRISNIFGKSNKIYARNCEVREVIDSKLVRNFLIKNHIQGFVGSKVKVGLFHNNELISLMTLGSLRKNLGQLNSIGIYELTRFCSKLGIVVAGGASKLLKYFISHFNPQKIISYSDNNFSSGDLYSKLGFIRVNKGIPNYYWVKDGKRYNRFVFRKDKLISDGFDKDKTEIEIMISRGYVRVFDSGSERWDLNYLYVTNLI